MLDAVALILPTIAMWKLLREKATLWGVKPGHLVRINLFFLSAVSFDILRNLGFDLASYGVQISAGFLFMIVGSLAANLYFCPESNTLREVWSRLKSRTSFLLYIGIVASWTALSTILPDWYSAYTIIVLAAGVIYPTALFNAARTRAKPPHVKRALATIAVAWFLFVTLGTILFALGMQPPALPVSVPLAWEMAFDVGSVLFFVMSVTEANPLGPVRFPTGQLVPETIIKPGHRYLILHDSGSRAIIFLASTFRSLIDSGSRIIIRPPTSSWLVTSLSQTEPRFSEWTKNGKVVVNETEPESGSQHEGFSERLSFGPISRIYLREIDRQNLQAPVIVANADTEERQDRRSEILLLESSKAPRPQLTEFLQRNSEIELLNLSESTNPFSALLGLDHQQLRGSAILFEYDNSSDYESAIDKFFAEGTSNAEFCILFTVKSSKLYRAIKGKRLIKIVAASSLISAPDELPDGEMQIPDKELGLVAAVASDFLDNSKNSGTTFVFDSITDLIRGERWEQVYDGIRQLIDLLTVPNATALFLVNVNSTENRFLGALRGAFGVQIRMDDKGVRAVKVPARKSA